jgi:hypothetical protein
MTTTRRTDAAESKTRMAAQAYTRSGEWSEVRILKGESGWIIECDSQISGTNTESRVLIPFGGDFPRGCDLDANWNDLGSYGCALIDRAKSVLCDPEAKRYYHARILARGNEVS